MKTRGTVNPPFEFRCPHGQSCAKRAVGYAGLPKASYYQPTDWQVSWRKRINSDESSGNPSTRPEKIEIATNSETTNGKWQMGNGSWEMIHAFSIEHYFLEPAHAVCQNPASDGQRRWMESAFDKMQARLERMTRK